MFEDISWMKNIDVYVCDPWLHPLFQLANQRQFPFPRIPDGEVSIYTVAGETLFAMLDPQGPPPTPPPKMS